MGKKTTCIFCVTKSWGPLSTSLSVSSGFRRLTAAQDLQGSEGQTLLCIFILYFFILLHQLSSLFCEASSLYTYTKQRHFSELWTSRYLRRSQMWSVWKTLFLTACPAKRKTVAGKWLLMYLIEQNRDMAVGTQVSGYVTKFSHWQSHGVGEAIR